jgi:hypothetical protein
MFVGFLDSENRPSRERVTSMVVNAHGGLFRLRADVCRGQVLTIINAKKSQNANSCVVWVRHLPDEMNLVAFELEEPTPSIWPVIGWPENWYPAKGEREASTGKSSV